MKLLFLISLSQPPSGSNELSTSLNIFFLHAFFTSTSMSLSCTKNILDKSCTIKCIQAVVADQAFIMCCTYPHGGSIIHAGGEFSSRSTIYLSCLTHTSVYYISKRVCMDTEGWADCPPVDVRGQTAGLWVNADRQRECRLKRRWCLL